MDAVEGVPGRNRRGEIAFVAVVLIAAALSGLLLAPPVAARSGGPDACGYTWINSNPPTPRVSFNWIEIKDNGTLITSADWIGGGDDGYFDVALGFNLTFYDGTYSDTWIGTNGYASFGQGYWEYALPPIPDPQDPNNAAYVFGEDLQPEVATGQGGVYYLQLTSPNRLVAEWFQVPHYGGANPVTFEVIFYESGEIWFQYLSLSGSVTVVGIENKDGSVALDYGTVLSNNLAIQFLPPSSTPGPVGVDLSPCAQGRKAVPGTSAAAEVRVTNTGTGGSDTIDMTFNSPSGWSGTFYASDGVTPLPDTDSDGIPDTGSLPSGGTVDVILRVAVPGAATGSETITITGTSSVDTGISDTSLALFTIVPAAFTPPHFDYGVDSNGNGQYDFLVVGINITVAVSDFYFVSAELHDPTFALDLYNSTFLILPLGLTTLSMWYDGRTINASGIDGPYLVDLTLSGANGTLDTGRHVTQAYSHLQFEEPPAAWSPPHSEAVTDVDGDGRYDYLLVNANFTVNSPGFYAVYGILSDPTFTLSLFASNGSFFSPGPATLQLQFRGVTLNESGIDGPYNVDLYLYQFSPGFFYLGHSLYVTRPYAHTQFEEVPRIDAPFAAQKPTIDGAIGGAEWSDAAVVNLTAISGNSLPAFLLVKSDYANLYVAYDAVGDTTQDSFDAASISFDTGNDGVATDGHEDEFVQGAPFNGSAQSHWVYNSSFGAWVIEDAPYNPGLPNHTGLASAQGFGASPNSAANHRMYEFSIPLALLGARPGDTLGFWGGSSPIFYGVRDGSTFSGSQWPENNFLPVWAYGDLGLAPDTTPPTVTITAPSSGTLFTVGSVDVTWTGSDVGLGLDHYTVQMDGQAPIALPSSATSYTASGLADGNHTVVVTAWDQAGNSGNDSVTFTVDTTPPVVAITAPAPNAVLASGTVVLTWTASDATSGLDHFEISLDGGVPTARPASATSFTFNGVPDGPHTANLTAYDRAGHWITVLRDFTVDTVAPTIALSAPAPGYVTSGSVVVTWTASDTGAGLAQIEVILDGGTPIVLAGSATTYTLSGVTDGDHTISVQAIDLAGNSASDSVAVTVDQTPPTATLSSPASGAILTASQIALTWNAFDATSGLDRIEVSLDGGTPVVLAATASTYTFTSVADGSHTVRLAAFDNAGNSVSVSATVTVDTVPPTASITAPSASAILASSSVAVTWTASDATSGIDHFAIALDGVAQTIPAIATSYTFTGVSDGTHTIRLTAFDHAGHSTDATVMVTVDTTDPSLSITTPVEGAVVTTSSPTVQWTAGDATSGVDHLTLSVDGGTAQTLSASTTSQVLSGISDGAHSVTITVVDHAGNSATTTVSFRVDTSFFSPSGPYGSSGLIAIILLVVIVLVAAIFLIRRRRGARPPQGEL